MFEIYRDAYLLDLLRPHLPRKNAHYRCAGSKPVLTDQAKNYRTAVALACGEKGICAIFKKPRISSGSWGILVLVESDRMIEGHTDVDSDACIASTRDALQNCGLVDNDRRIVTSIGQTRFGPARRVLAALAPIEHLIWSRIPDMIRSPDTFDIRRHLR